MAAIRFGGMHGELHTMSSDSLVSQLHIQSLNM